MQRSHPAPSQGAVAFRGRILLIAGIFDEEPAVFALVSEPSVKVQCRLRERREDVLINSALDLGTVQSTTFCNHATALNAGDREPIRERMAPILQNVDSLRLAALKPR